VEKMLLELRTAWGEALGRMETKTGHQRGVGSWGTA